MPFSPLPTAARNHLFRLLKSPALAVAMTVTTAVLVSTLLLPVSVQAKDKTKAVFNIYLTGNADNDIPTEKPQNDFDCSEKVYLVVEVDGMELDEHQLMVKWFDPRGKQEELTRYNFHFVGDGTRIWAWLRLSGPPGAAIGRVFDPSFGMGSFIGEWRAEIYVNGKLVGKKKFEVLC